MPPRPSRAIYETGLFSTFIPNHPDFGRYNGILFKALQGVETGRLSPDEAIEFLEDELSTELGDRLKVVDSLG